MLDLFDEMERLHEDMERMFNRNLRGVERPLLGSKDDKNALNLYRTPLTNLHETDKKVIAKFEMPGVAKDKIDVNVTENAIEVKAEDKSEKKDEDKGYYRYESRCQSFYRRIPLPKEVDAQKAEAEYKDGILKIEIPKLKQIESKKKKLQIK